MRKRFTQLSWFGLLLLFPIILHAQGQSAKNKWPNEKHDCTGNCFSAEVISAVAGAGGCTDYELRIAHNGSCRYELSHVVVEMPCGMVSNLKAPNGFSTDFGKDPTTGLRGLKIDDIRNFGKGPAGSFTVKFTWCQSSACTTSDCWEPRVAFKAATCIDYDTAHNTCQKPPLTATTQKKDASCFGSSDGSLSVAVEGGEGPYTYSWSTGCHVASIDNLPAGTYTVTITDAQGNEVTVTEEIVATSAMDLSAITVNPTCAGIPNGTIDLSVDGGVEPYTYIWSNGATTQDLAGLAGGSYKVTVRDSIGCSKEAVFQLTPPVITITALTTRPGCGQTNGAIDITVSGGAEPYTYLWNNGATTQDVSSLAAGLYSVVVTDVNGCPSRTSFFLQENNTLKITFVVTPTSCVDNGSGAIDITVTGGTTPYSYLWANGSTSEDLTGLAAGVQRLTVTDASGCTATSIINVYRQGFSVASQVVPPSCTGQADGSITLTPAGVPPFTYLWSTGATTNAISNLSSDLYSVTVTDNTGCSQYLNYFINDPVIYPFTTVANPNCGAEGDFSIDLSVSGGVAPYDYQWSNGATTEDISGLNSGTYSVTITDANGCGKTVDVEVQPVVMDWSCSITPPAGNPVCGSSGNLLGTSVTGATSYAWSLQSDDDQWAISSGHNSSSVGYVAGGNGSTATFTLSITKGACTQTCSYTVTGCGPVITCGLDSTAAAASTVVATPAEPRETESLAKEPAKAEFRLAAYPNPVIDKVSFAWTAEASERVQIDIMDLFGKRIAELYAGAVNEGEVYSVNWDAGHLSDRLYFYRYTSETRTVYGKLFKGN